VAIDTRKVAGRRKLHFNSLDEVLADAERLVAGGSTQLGNWSLALVENASIDGFPELFPWPIRLLLKVVSPEGVPAVRAKCEELPGGAADRSG
jgi:hypothetical protein